MEQKTSLFIKLKNKYGINLILGSILVLAIIISIVIIQGVKIYRVHSEEPTSLEAINVTTNSVELYWKSSDKSVQKLSYKEKNSSGLYSNTISVSSDVYDNDSKKYVYHATIRNLKDNTDYVYRIDSTNNKWGDYTFSTDNVDDKVSLEPKIVNGSTDKYRLVLVKVGNEKYMLDTQDHGTYAFNSNGEKPEFIEYANYSNNDVLGETIKQEWIFTEDSVTQITGLPTDPNTNVTIYYQMVDDDGKVVKSGDFRISRQDPYVICNSGGGSIGCSSVNSDSNQASYHKNNCNFNTGECDNSYSKKTSSSSTEDPGQTEDPTQTPKSGTETCENFDSRSGRNRLYNLFDSTNQLGNNYTTDQKKLEQFNKYIKNAQDISSTNANNWTEQVIDMIKKKGKYKDSEMLQNLNLNKLKQTILLELAANGCTENECLNDAMKNAADDMITLLEAFHSKLKEEIVSFTDTFNVEGVSGSGIKNTDTKNMAPGEQTVRICNQTDYCVKQNGYGTNGECFVNRAKDANGTYIGLIQIYEQNVDEAKKDDKCVLNPITCIDQMQPKCQNLYERTDGCKNPSSIDGITYTPVNGEYHCPQSFAEGTEFLLSEGETDYTTGFCYGVGASKEDVQRGTPSAYFINKKCVYPSLLEYEKETAMSDDYIAGQDLNGVGEGFADKTEIDSDEKTCIDCDGCVVKSDDGEILEEVKNGDKPKGGDKNNDSSDNDDSSDDSWDDIEDTGTGPGTGPGTGTNPIDDEDTEGDEYVCYENEDILQVGSTERECTSDKGCVCVYSDGTKICAEKGDTCKTDGTISSYYCSKDEDILQITTSDKECTSDSGCACLYYSGTSFQCAEKGQICKTDGTVVEKTDTDGEKTKLEVDENTPQKACVDKDGCTCVYTLPGESETSKNIDYGEVCSYPDNKRTKLELTEDKPSQDCLDEDGCTCTYPSSSNIESFNIDKGYTCTLDGKSEQTNNACCYYKKDLSMINDTYCKKVASEKTDYSVVSYSAIDQDHCHLRKAGLVFEKGNNFFEAYEIVNKDDVPIKTAKDLITYTYHKILAIGSFASNQWIDIVKYSTKNCQTEDHICGEDFELKPGNIYYVVARSEFKLSTYTYGTLSSSDEEYATVTKNITGWNLVPSGLFIQEENGTIDIIQNPDYDISQIAVWDKKLAQYEYTVKDALGEIYGSDIDLTKQPGIFIKISRE